MKGLCYSLHRDLGTLAYIVPIVVILAAILPPIPAAEKSEKNCLPGRVSVCLPR